MSTAIYWMLVDSEQTPPETMGVLSPSELERFSTFRFPKRQKEWLLGRWTSKTLAHSLPAYRDYPLDQIEIRNTPKGAPSIHVLGGTTSLDCLTISHSNHLALCAMASGPDLRVGADLEVVEPRTETFILDYFTPGERQIVAGCPAETRAIVVTLIWSVKEAMLKALGVGLRWDTRKVEVRHVGDIQPAGRSDGDWNKIRVGEGSPDQRVGEDQPGQRVWTAWWQRRQQFVLSLAAFAVGQADIRSVQLIEKQVSG
jgi:4'-phosphopantetheinyl transferase